MTRSRGDLLWGAGLLLVAALLVAQLLLGDADGGFQLAARVLRLVLVLALSALFLTALDLAAIAVAAGSVVLLILVWTVGLLVSPGQFVGTGAKAPENVEEAQALGLLLTALVLVVAVAILRRWWRSRTAR